MGTAESEKLNTYFIDRLREVLLKRMEEDDEKHYRSR
mgnify:CR=1 FL=1